MMPSNNWRRKAAPPAVYQRRLAADGRLRRRRPRPAAGASAEAGRVARALAGHYARPLNGAWHVGAGDGEKFVRARRISAHRRR